MKKILISMGIAATLISSLTTVAFAEGLQNNSGETNQVEFVQPKAALGSNVKFSSATGSGKTFRGNFLVKYRTGSNLGVSQSTTNGTSAKTSFQYQTINGTDVGNAIPVGGTVNGYYTSPIMLNPGEYQIKVKNLGATLSSSSNFWFHINS